MGAIENEPERKGNRADQGQEEDPAGTETNGEPLSVVPLSATMLVRSASYWVGWPALCLAGQLWQGVAERAAWVATNDHRHTLTVGHGVSGRGKIKQWNSERRGGMGRVGLSRANLGQLIIIISEETLVDSCAVADCVYCVVTSCS